MMDDDSNQDSDDLDDDVHVRSTTATPMVEMDGEGGENATTDATTKTEYSPCPCDNGLWPLHVPIGVGGFVFV